MAAYDEDFLLALQLQDQLNQIENNRNGGSTDSELHKSAEKKYTSDVMSVIDPRWEMIDPSPDARAMFLEFNDKYFSGNLAGVEVRWSPRMTLCAGVCCYEGRGGLCSIRLSEPLLKLRPRKDLVETLLHEMIHAFLFVTQNNKDRDGHGPEFCKHMDRINESSGSHITIYHSFHDEVENYRKHWWKCDGPCQQRRPYYGYVKRAMNRAPSPRDPWWPDHQRTCGGTYHKVKEPEGYGVKKSSKKQSNEKPPVKTNKPSSQDIRGLFNKHDSNHNNSAAATAVSSENPSHKESDLPMLPKLPSVDSGANIRGFDGVVEGRSVSVFTGAGQSLGGQGTSSRTNVIVRRIPGVGVIETRVGVALTGGAMSNNTATDETDDASTLTQIGNNTAASSNNLSRQDNKGGADHSSSSSASNKHGGENVSRSKRKHSDSECETNRIPNKRAKQLSVRDLFSAQGASQPVGTQVTIPGFTSVSNKQAAKDRVGSREADRDNCAKDRVGSRAADRDNCAKERGGSWAADRDNRAKERGGSRAADRDNRAKERGGSWAADRNNRAHHLSNSESDDEEKQPLSSVLHTSQTSTVGGRPKSQTSTDRGQPKSQTSTDWGQPNSQTSTERGQPKSQTSNERGQPKSQTSTDRGQPKSQTDGGQPLAAGSNGHQNDATLVACPVCLASMPQAEINAHLDSCLS